MRRFPRPGFEGEGEAKGAGEATGEATLSDRPKLPSATVQLPDRPLPSIEYI